MSASLLGEVDKLIDETEAELASLKIVRAVLMRRRGTSEETAERVATAFAAAASQIKSPKQRIFRTEEVVPMIVELLRESGVAMTLSALRKETGVTKTTILRAAESAVLRGLVGREATDRVAFGQPIYAYRIIGQDGAQQ